MNKDFKIYFSDGTDSDEWLADEIEQEINDADFDSDLDLDFGEVEWCDLSE